VAMYHYEYYILSEDTMRERRGNYNVCVVGCIPLFAR
jgi:hypothetical protein